MELLIRKLETEPSFHRKVDLFFLVDSITQCSHNQKGIYPGEFSFLKNDYNFFLGTCPGLEPFRSFVIFMSEHVYLF